MKKIIVLLSCLLFLTGCGKEEVDMTKNIQLTFKGVNGLGSAEVVKNGDFDQSFEANTLIECSEYVIESNENLSNGDKVIVTCNPNTATADYYKLNPINLTKEFVVEGLEPVYLHAKQISKEDQKKLETAASKKVDEYMTDFFREYGFENIIDKKELIGKFFRYEKYTKKGSMYFVFYTKMHYKQVEEKMFTMHEDGDIEERYFCIEVANLSPNVEISDSKSYNTIYVDYHSKEDLSNRDMNNLVKKKKENMEVVYEKD